MRRWNSQPNTPINPESTTQTYGVTDEEKSKWNSKQDALEYDEEPTSGSNKALTSNAVYDALIKLVSTVTQAYKDYFTASKSGLAEIAQECATTQAALATDIENVQTLKDDIYDLKETMNERTEAALSYRNGAADSAATSKSYAEQAFVSADRADEDSATATAAKESALSSLEDVTAKQSEVTTMYDKVVELTPQAETSATNAATSEANANTSATTASEQATIATQQAAIATDKATQVSDIATSLQTTVDAATKAAEDAQEATEEAQEAAKQITDYVTRAETAATNAETYQSNAGTYATNAAESEESALASKNAAAASATSAGASQSSAATEATTATNKALLAQSYLQGGTGARAGEDTDNVVYYYTQLVDKLARVSNALVPQGNTTFAELITKTSTAQAGDQYNVTDAFTTDDNFNTSGEAHGAGTNVYMTATGKWDALPGVSVTGIKGSAETTYRVGQIEITAANLGLAAVATSGSASDLSDVVTYTLTQDSTDGHVLTFTPSVGDATSITIPDTDTVNTVGAYNNTGYKRFVVLTNAQKKSVVSTTYANLYIGSDNKLYSGGNKVTTDDQLGTVTFTKSGDDQYINWE